jgi:hypothetical protein
MVRSSAFTGSGRLVELYIERDDDPAAGRAQRLVAYQRGAGEGLQL